MCVRLKRIEQGRFQLILASARVRSCTVKTVNNILGDHFKASFPFQGSGYKQIIYTWPGLSTLYSVVHLLFYRMSLDTQLT